MDSEYEEMAGQRVARDPAQVPAGLKTNKRTVKQTNKVEAFGPSNLDSANLQPNKQTVKQSNKQTNKQEVSRPSNLDS